jgi:hypothetical protein
MNYQLKEQNIKEVYIFLQGLSIYEKNGIVFGGNKKIEQNYF